MKKKILGLLLIMLLSMVGCTHNKKEDKIEVITTIFPLYDFVREIKSDDINVSMLLSPGQEVHTFDPSAKDIVNIHQCDLFIYIGGESDEWLNDILKDVNNERFHSIKLMDYVDNLFEDDTKEEYDEHIWTSPVNAKIMVEEISKALQTIVEDKEEIISNTASYVEKLNKLDEDFKNVIENADYKVMVFGDRFPFLYFAHEYGLQCHAAFSGCSTETEASAKQIKQLVDIIVNTSLKYVYYIGLSNKNVATAIATDAKVDMLLFHSTQNVSLDEFNREETYLTLMSANVEALQRGLSK